MRGTPRERPQGRFSGSTSTLSTRVARTHEDRSPEGQLRRPWQASEASVLTHARERELTPTLRAGKILGMENTTPTHAHDGGPFYACSICQQVRDHPNHLLVDET